MLLVPQSPKNLCKEFSKKVLVKKKKKIVKNTWKTMLCSQPVTVISAATSQTKITFFLNRFSFFICLTTFLHLNIYNRSSSKYKLQQILHCGSRSVKINKKENSAISYCCFSQNVHPCSAC